MVVVEGVKITMVFFIALGLGRLQSPVETTLRSSPSHFKI
jgi:hypothetical protein